MADAIKKVKAITDYSQMYTTKAGAESGQQDYVDEADIYTEAFETGDLYAEVQEDGETVKLYKKGEDGEPIGMGWTTIDAIDTGQTNDTARSAKTILAEQEKLRSELTEYTDMHDKNQISNREFYEKRDLIKLRLAQLSLESYQERFDRGQMDPDEYSQKTKEANEQILELRRNITRYAHANDAEWLQQQNSEDISNDSKDINTNNKSRHITSEITSSGYKITYVENGKLVVREFDIFGQETSASKLRNGFSKIPIDVQNSVRETIKNKNLEMAQAKNSKQTETNDLNNIVDRLKNAISAETSKVAHLANDKATSKTQDAATRLQAGTINANTGLESINSLKNRVNNPPMIFDGTNLEQLKEMKEKYGARFAVDVSENNGSIDWKAAKNAGIDRAIIRSNMQYWGVDRDGTSYVDSRALENVKAAIDAGIEVQLYSFDVSKNTKEAETEAQAVINFINSLPKEYRNKIKQPIILDHEVYDTYTENGVESDTRLKGLTFKQHTENIAAFNKYMNNRGYETMTYGSASHLGTRFDGKGLTNKNNSIWAASWGSTPENSYDGEYKIWQYSNSGSVAGFGGVVDLNIYYENPNTKKVDATSDSKDIKSNQTTVSKISIQPTLSGYNATYVENGKLVTKKYDMFGRETSESLLSSKGSTPKEVEIALLENIKSNNIRKSKINNAKQHNQNSSTNNASPSLVKNLMQEITDGVAKAKASSVRQNNQNSKTNNASPSLVENLMREIADGVAKAQTNNAKQNNQNSKINNASPSLVENLMREIADGVAEKSKAEAQKLQAAKFNGIKTEKGSLIIDNAGKKSRVYMYDKNGKITAITELNTKQKVKEIKYKDGVATATFDNGKIQTYKIDKNGNLKAFGFYGGRQNYEDATDAQKQIVDIAKNENGEYSLTTTPNMCWAYVNDVYASAGLIEREHLGSATLEMYEIEKNWGLSENFDNIPVGAAVFTDHSAGDGVWEGGYSAGHVAIYIGNGMVRENIGGIVDTPLDQWINTWKNNVPGARVAWGWPGGKDLTETNKLTKVISVENSTKTTNNNSVKKDNNITKQQNIKTYKNGASYHQPQGNGVDYNIGNCGTTSMLQAVNMLEGENKYTDNIKEWENMGSNSEGIAVDGGQYIKTWLDKKGLSKDIEVVQAYDYNNHNSKASQNISGTDDLINHLKNGEVCILSANGPVFKQNNGGYKELNHVVTFYMGDNNKIYCNDPGSNPSLGAGVEYTRGDIDNFFTCLVGSVSLKKKK